MSSEKTITRDEPRSFKDEDQNFVLYIIVPAYWISESSLFFVAQHISLLEANSPWIVVMGSSGKNGPNEINDHRLVQASPGYCTILSGISETATTVSTVGSYSSIICRKTTRLSLDMPGRVWLIASPEAGVG
jgi:hypothetical protein